MGFLQLDLPHRNGMQSCEVNAIHEYGIELQRRARKIVAAAQDHRDTTDMNDEPVEAADREGAPAEESSALL